MSKNEGVVEDAISRVNEEAKVPGAMNRIWKVGSFCMDVKIYEREVTTLLYGAETWGFDSEGKEKTEFDGNVIFKEDI